MIPLYGVSLCATGARGEYRDRPDERSRSN